MSTHKSIFNRQLTAITMGMCALSLSLFTGCGKKGSSGASPEAAIVSGGDVLLSVDLAAMNQSAFIKATQKETDEQKAMKEKFTAATGLTDEDVLMVIASADLDSIDTKAENMEAEISKLSATLGISLAKAISAEQLEAGLDLLLEEAGGEVTKGRATLSGSEVITLTSDEPEAPTIYVALGQSGQVVLAAINETSMSAALARATSGKSESISKAVKAVESALPSNGQAKLSIVLSGAMKTELTKGIDGMTSDPQQAMMAGFVTPFRELASISLGMVADDNMHLNLAANLGSEEGATKALGTLQMLIPMVTGPLSAQAGLTPQQMQEKINLKAVGSSLVLKVSIAADDIKPTEPAE